jgi:hypothetical protein
MGHETVVANEFAIGLLFPHALLEPKLYTKE